MFGGGRVFSGMRERESSWSFPDPACCFIVADHVVSVALARIPMEIGGWWQQVQLGNHTNALFVSQSCHLQHTLKKRKKEVFMGLVARRHFQQD